MGQDLPDVAQLRKDYTLADLAREDLEPDALKQFSKWFNAALAAGVEEPNATVLSTADGRGRPAGRVVLLKGVDERGFSFFTNYESRKAAQLAANPRAALTFFWSKVERQVCIAGSVTKLGKEESEDYFRTRPRGNRLGAWVSNQSSIIVSREYLEQRLAQVEKDYPDDNIPMPPYWGGYLLAPETIEFWQGRLNRLHDRFLYSKSGGGGWRVDRLSP